MIGVHRRFCEQISQQVSSQVLWDHLGTLYDLEALVS